MKLAVYGKGDMSKLMYSTAQPYLLIFVIGFAIISGVTILLVLVVRLHRVRSDSQYVNQVPYVVTLRLTSLLATLLLLPFPLLWLQWLWHGSQRICRALSSMINEHERHKTLTHYLGDYHPHDTDLTCWFLDADAEHGHRVRGCLGQTIAGSRWGHDPARCSSHGWRLAIFPQGGPCSIVTATRFHRRVRDGSACCPCARGTSTWHRTGRRAHCQPLL